eukprot:765352-Hanusia_phi.AAC.1
MMRRRRTMGWWRQVNCKLARVVLRGVSDARGSDVLTERGRRYEIVRGREVEEGGRGENRKGKGDKAKEEEETEEEEKEETEDKEEEEEEEEEEGEGEGAILFLPHL